MDTNLAAAIASINNADGLITSQNDILVQQSQSLTDLKAQLAGAQGDYKSALVNIENLEAKIALPPIATPKPVSLKGLFSAAGWKSTEFYGHLETWWNQAASHDSPRRPMYDQSNPYQVATHVAHIKEMGWDGITTNGYTPDNPATKCAILYFKETLNQGIGIMPNIDKSVWASVSGSGQPQQIQTLIQGYIDGFLRPNVLGQKNVKLFDGRKAITFFATGKAPENADLFAALAADKKNSDLMFFNNVGSYGGNQMGWVQSDLIANTAWWIKTYASRKGTRNIVPLYKGFDDTVTRNGAATSVWNAAAPARVWSVDNNGPGLTTLLACRDAIIAGYKALGIEPDMVQGVTLNDYQEGTNLEGKLQWTPAELGW